MLTNITVDNKNTTAINYYPPLCNGTGWHEENSNSAYAFDNTYTYCHGSYDAKATFSFTGVAVYFTIPLFKENDSMYFQLDDRPFENVNFMSPTGDSLSSRVVWSATDLENEPHQLQLLPGLYDGEYGYVSVDAFIYTASDEPLASSGSAESSTNKVAIGVGVGLGIVVIALAALVLFFWRRSVSKNYTSPGNPQLPTSPGTEPSFLAGTSPLTPRFDTPYRQSVMGVTPNSTGTHGAAFAPPFAVPSDSTPSPQANNPVYV